MAVLVRGVAHVVNCLSRVCSFVRVFGNLSDFGVLSFDTSFLGTLAAVVGALVVLFVSSLQLRVLLLAHVQCS